MNKQTKTDIWLTVFTAFMATLVIVGLLSGLAISAAEQLGEGVSFDAVRRP